MYDTLSKSIILERTITLAQLKLLLITSALVWSSILQLVFWPTNLWPFLLWTAVGAIAGYLSANIYLGYQVVAGRIIAHNALYVVIKGIVAVPLITTIVVLFLRYWLTS